MSGMYESYDLWCIVLIQVPSTPKLYQYKYIKNYGFSILKEQTRELVRAGPEAVQQEEEAAWSVP